MVANPAVVGLIAVLTPFVMLSPFVVAGLLGRRRARRRMDGLFSPVRAASSSTGDAAGGDGLRPLVPCGRFADGGRGACPPPTPSPVSVFSAPAPVVAVKPSVPRARARTAHGPGHSNPWHTVGAISVALVLFACLMVAMACQPVDDSGTNGVVEPTSEGETDSGSQP